MYSRSSLQFVSRTPAFKPRTCICSANLHKKKHVMNNNRRICISSRIKRLSDRSDDPSYFLPARYTPAFHRGLFTEPLKSAVYRRTSCRIPGASQQASPDPSCQEKHDSSVLQVKYFDGRDAALSRRDSIPDPDPWASFASQFAVQGPLKEASTKSGVACDGGQPNTTEINAVLHRQDFLYAHAVIDVRCRGNSSGDGTNLSSLVAESPLSGKME